MSQNRWTREGFGLCLRLSLIYKLYRSDLLLVSPRFILFLVKIDTCSPQSGIQGLLRNQWGVFQTSTTDVQVIFYNVKF